jgi:hypothetical protein
MIGLLFVKTDDSGAASGFPASGDSAGVQPVIAIAAAVTAEQRNLRIMIHPCGWYSDIAIRRHNLSRTFRHNQWVTKVRYGVGRRHFTQG